MSRMFRIISGGNESNEPRAVNGTGSEKPTLDLFGGGVIPFVEVGGPDGLVSSIAGRASPARTNLNGNGTANGHLQAPAPTLPLPTPVSTKIEAPKPPPPIDSKVLSVTFHRFPKQGLRVMDSGVAPEIVAYHFPDHPVSAEYRIVRDEVLKQYEEPGPKVIAFTAASSTAGTTTVMLNVAATLSQDHGYRVLLVDANYSRPGVARRLSASESPGLAEVLGQTLPLAWALQPTPLLNLHVLAGGNPADATEGAMAADFPRLMAQLRQWFDWVVIDAGVWSEFPAAEGTSTTCDGLYLVTRETDLDRADFTQMRADIAASGGAVRGYISTRQ